MENLIKIKKNLENLENINSKVMSKNINPEYQILPNGKIEVDLNTSIRRGLTTKKINHAKNLAGKSKEKINEIITRRSK